MPNISSQALEANIDLQGVIKAGPQVKVITLTSEDLNDENSLQEPRKIYPVENSISVSGTKFSYNFVPYSFTILRVSIEK